VRRAAKVDANQEAIVKALRKIGALVTSLAAVGNGVPDLVVWYAGLWTMLEVKDGNKPPSARKLTDEQAKWHAVHADARVFVVTTTDEAIAAVQRKPG
jgi:hypothetical protein